MSVRFRQFVKIGDNRFMAQKGLLQHAADQTSLSHFGICLPSSTLLVFPPLGMRPSGTTVTEAEMNSSPNTTTLCQI